MMRPQLHITEQMEPFLEYHPDITGQARENILPITSRTVQNASDIKQRTRNLLVSYRHLYLLNDFESIAIDLFGPLPETSEDMKWIFIAEDCTTKWVELFPLKQATAKECALSLLNEVFLRYGLQRRLISDNGSQFVSAIMQQLCYVLNINQSLIPVYHPQANPVERKNKDLKPRLAMMVGNNHTLWNE
ncbi:hypothetical protein AVEN_68813-1 [Araneus ventricosus]|uniref:Integrase catalytic domain-containing protein n=1 Tax=Araneus ventricosus TaxID=182803 RepID=A0A4Y2C4Z4_ARAVE|nr:hypothetical protein AVEN_68813-1 [Araneus ventricosus]